MVKLTIDKEKTRKAFGDIAKAREGVLGKISTPTGRTIGILGEKERAQEKKQESAENVDVQEKIRDIQEQIRDLRKRVRRLELESDEK